MGEEREIKSDVAATFELPDLDGVAGLTAVDDGVHVLDATYWDTDSLQLVHAGYGLRYRTTDGTAGLWTLKSGSHRDGDAMVREEIELPGRSDTIPAEMAERLRDVTEPARVHPVVRVRTERHIVDLEDGASPWAEVADDRVTVFDGETVVERFHEVEVELDSAADNTRVEAVMQRMREAGAGAPSASSKYVRALRAVGYDVGELTD